MAKKIKKAYMVINEKTRKTLSFFLVLSTDLLKPSIINCTSDSLE